MRLWHQALIDKLPRQQLLGQHRECCAMRGLGWGRKHRTVDYVWKHPFIYLVAYHMEVLCEMIERSYRPSIEWLEWNYRGKRAERLNCPKSRPHIRPLGRLYIYPEHDDAYLQECIENLRGKGVELDV